MRSIGVFALAALAAFAAGATVPPTGQSVIADEQFLKRQETIFALLRHVNQADYNDEILQLAQKFNPVENQDSYTNRQAIKEFAHQLQHGFLPQGEIFSILNEEQREEAIALFNVLYYAKDFETLVGTAAWARVNVNEGLFVYAFSAAVLQRNDLAGIILPAPYEINPYYFFTNEVITKAQQNVQQGIDRLKKIDNVPTVIIQHNYTGSFIRTNPEQKISYFTEDIGLNSYYYYFNLDYPFWLGGSEFGLVNDRRGELYLYLHQQILARYYLERLSNNLGHIPELSWEQPLKTGYYPSLQYYNGHSFPQRENYYIFNKEENYGKLTVVQDYERRIRDVIDQGFVVLQNGKLVNITTPEGIDVLGNLIQGNPDSVNSRFYKPIGEYARLILGASVEPFGSDVIIPSVLEHFETSLRDPVFYQFIKRIVYQYFQYKDELPSYTSEELTFPGVKIERAEVDKLVTYFDRYDVDITNSVDVPVQQESKTKAVPGQINNQPEQVIVKARTTLLNHKPFNYKLTVSSEKAAKSVVRVYIGPKYNEYGSIYSLPENRENFFELDQFVFDLQSGTNVIERNSANFNNVVKDRTPFYELNNKVQQAESGQYKFPLDQSEAHNGFPARLILPKGTKGGQTFQIFFAISEYQEPATPQHKGYDPVVSSGIGSGARYIDSLPFGYPLDRWVDEVAFENVPNFLLEDVQIFHKKQNEINIVN